MAFAVKPSLWTLFGSGDATLVKDTCEGSGTGDQAWIDAMIQENAYGDDDERLPDARQALRQMIMGEPLDERIAFVYGYWLKNLCARDVHLPNGAWLPIPPVWSRNVQEGLSRAGINGIQIDSILLNSPPIELPPADFPAIGFTSHTQMPALLQAFSACDLTAEPDSQVRASIQELWGWLKFCHQHGMDLVCFYH